MHPVTAEVTERIVERSRETRADYLARMERRATPARPRQALLRQLGPRLRRRADGDKQRMRDPTAPNVAIVSAYNDMLSAHQPLERFPTIIRRAPARSAARPSTPAACRPCAMG
jgi:phosphogluconate dehydratase